MNLARDEMEGSQKELNGTECSSVHFGEVHNTTTIFPSLEVGHSNFPGCRFFIIFPFDPSRALSPD